MGFDGKMEKCDLCVHRVSKGGIPACVENCPSEAMVFGTMVELSKTIREKYSVRSLGLSSPVMNPTVSTDQFETKQVKAGTDGVPA